MKLFLLCLAEFSIQSKAEPKLNCEGDRHPSEPPGFQNLFCILDGYEILPNSAIDLPDANGDVVKNLLIMNSKVTEVPKALIGRDGLQLLGIGNSSLSVIRKSDFADVRGRRIVLDRDDKRILEEKSLQKLSFPNNLIRSIEANTFDNLPSLNYLDLSDNLIEIVHEDAFKGADKLKTIFLQGNRLKSISPRLFESIHEIRTASLGRNLFEGELSLDLRPYIFCQLALEENNLTKLNLRIMPSKKAYESLSVKIDLDINLAGNRIQEIDLVLDDFLDEFNLNLILSRNNLRTLPKMPYELLKSLVLSQNPLNFDNRNLFAQLQGLKSLNLKGTNMTNEDLRDLAQLESLESLNLSNNRLNGTFDMSLLKNLRNLRSLKLENNALNGISIEGIAEWYPKELEVAVKGNQIDVSTLNEKLKAKNIVVFD